MFRMYKSRKLADCSQQTRGQGERGVECEDHYGGENDPSDEMEAVVEDVEECAGIYAGWSGCWDWQGEPKWLDRDRG